jgi:hypothetical protein
VVVGVVSCRNGAVFDVHRMPQVRFHASNRQAGRCASHHQLIVIFMFVTYLTSMFMFVRCMIFLLIPPFIVNDSVFHE